METEELLEQQGPILIPGVHGPPAEIEFVNRVVQDEIRPRYAGSILLMGSRADPKKPIWMSRVNFFGWCSTHHIREAVAAEWFWRLNDEAIKRGLTRAQMPLLVDLPDAPKFIQECLENLGPAAAADYDLLLTGAEELPPELSRLYRDKRDKRHNTGQTVEVITLNDIMVKGTPEEDSESTTF